MKLELRDKLDVVAVLDATVVVDGVGVANGPEDTPVDWQSIDWRRVEGDVERLRQRIFAASKAGTWPPWCGFIHPLDYLLQLLSLPRFRVAFVRRDGGHVGGLAPPRWTL